MQYCIFAGLPEIMPSHLCLKMQLIFYRLPLFFFPGSNLLECANAGFNAMVWHLLLTAQGILSSPSS
jgi:hypothetical protein